MMTMIMMVVMTSSCYYQKDKLYPIKTRERMIEQIPSIAETFPNWG